MKRLILIQNDFSGAGKTTLAQCLHHYLDTYRVSHHRAAIVETSDDSRPVSQIEAASLRLPRLIAELDKSDLVIIEIESGFAELFSGFYKKHELEHLLPDLGFELSVLVPVTSDRESFDGVTAAAESYSDGAQYLVVHTPTSSLYDEDERSWDRSRAARIMDMFEAADLDMPACSASFELKLKLARTELLDALSHPAADAALQDETTKWFRRVTGQIDVARNYIFGDGFRPTIALKSETRKQRKPRTPKVKAPVLQEAAA